ncbi:MAG: aldo/keto reductase [Spirochaetes bacterium]|nr:aldo/keto reductase [Spirochaetota bacterium]
MKYRKFGKLDWEASVLGFGAMRLPVSGEVILPFNPNVDEPEAIKMIRHSVDSGVNYIDTAFPYHAGKSEVVVGRALKDGYREKVKIATKLPLFIVNTKDDLDKIFNEQMERLDTEFVDFYLMHGLNKMAWSKVKDLNILDWAEKKMGAGLIKHLGFSFHDEYDVFKGIADGYDNWAMCQIQYNFMDTEYQAGTKGLKYAADKGMAVVIMEPLRGGLLVKAPPESIKKLWADAGKKMSPAEWALLWIWNQPEVSVVLSGMSEMKQVEENLSAADRAETGLLSASDLEVVKKVKQEYRKLSKIPCTRCNYCMPCPNGVSIPTVFDLYNTAFMYDDPAPSRLQYGFLPEEVRAGSCIECGQCEEKCPQNIPIMGWLKKVNDLLYTEPIEIPGSSK